MSDDTSSQTPDSGSDSGASQSGGSGTTAGGEFEAPSIEELDKVLSNYEFIDILGKGGMGAVYKARQPKLDRLVAIKILPAVLDDEEMNFSERFKREAQAMAKLNHPNIVSVFDFGQTSDDQLFFVMEFVEGTDLDQVIATKQATVEHVYGWVPQVCSALQYAHSKGIVHRDIKPANILIDKQGNVKIADFGLAKLTGADSQQHKLTMTNVAMGTPDYVAPESLEEGKEPDHRADLYAVGVILYEMLTGLIPRGAFRPASQRVEGLDPRFDDVISMAMAEDREERYQQADEIRQAILEIQNVTVAPPTAAIRPQLVTGPVIAGLRTGTVSVRSSGATGTVTNRYVPREKPKAGKGVILGGASAIVLALAFLWLIVSNNRKEKAKSPVKQSAAAATAKSKSPSTAQKETGKPKPSPSPPPQPPSDDRPLSKVFYSNQNPSNPLSLKRPTAIGEVIAWARGGPEENVETLGERPDILERVVDIEVLDHRTAGVLALREDGTVVNWLDETVPPHWRVHNLPEGLEGLVDIDAGNNFAIGLKEDGTVLGWGDTGVGQMRFPKGLEEVIAISAGWKHSLALKKDGTVVTWGTNTNDRLKLPEDFTNAVAVAAGGTHSLVLKSDGTAVGWGRNDYGQADIPDHEGRIVAIAAIAEDSCMLTEHGVAHYWGQTQSELAEVPATIKDIRQIILHRGVAAMQAKEGDWYFFGKGTNKGRARNNSEKAVRVALTGRQAFALKVDPQSFAASLSGEKQLAAASVPSALEPPVDPARSKQSDPEPAKPPDNPPKPKAQPKSEAERRMAGIRETFVERYNQAIGGGHEAKVGALNDQFLAALGRSRKQAEDAGNLDGVVAIRTEVERVVDGKPLPENDDSAPEPIKTLRKTYRAQLAKLEAERDQAAGSLMSELDKALEQLQVELTQKEKIEEAVKVRSARADIKTQGAAFLAPRDTGSD